ncbi:MAG: MBL fold metallo-hydrolase [Gammaproteobacteria bacterium]|nr:MBL fold metallo-hydrolase [Gammaproteobacteria bacterium]
MLTCNKQLRLASTLFALMFFSTPLLAETATETSQSTTTKYAPTSVDMEVKKVSEHVYYVEGVPGIATDNEGFISNAGFIVTDDGVVVFDSLGTPSLANKLIQKIKSVTDQPIKKVIVSHFHADHIYGLQVFEELGAEIIAPYGAQKYIQSEAAASRLEERQFSLEPWVNEDTHLVLPDTTVEKSNTFKLGGITFTINYMGKAHSDGDLTLLVEPDKVLFSGDIIFEGRIPFVGSADSKKWLDTLTRLETGGLSVLIPGHGPASNNPKETISLTRRYLAYLRKVLGEGIEDLTPFEEVYADADWSEFKDLPAFSEGNRINAYQVYLSMEAELLEQ